MIEIKHRYRRHVIYSADCETVKDAVVEAVGKGAYLGGAYLGGADLGGADLGGAYLRGAKFTFGDMVGNTAYVSSGFGSENRQTVGVPTDKGIYIYCGCWDGWLKDFTDRVSDVYKDSPIKKEYLLMADMFTARYERQQETK